MRNYLFLCLLCGSPFVFAAETRITRDGVDFFISARTPEQTSAFYSARGLPTAAVKEISKACFLTIGLHNRRADILWLELSGWRLTDADGHVVARISRPEWTARWNVLQVPLAAQSTFGWTQLPETRDMQPDESVGGNVPIVPPAGKFTLSARFRTGANGGGPPLEISVPGLFCTQEGAPN